jgi:hypothetical protein
MPSWVAQQLADAAGLFAEVPERAKTEFQRLDIEFVLHPVRDKGQPPFLRAVGSGDFEHLAFSQYAAFPTTGSSHQRSTGSRKFVVDLPANQLGPGRKRRAG